MKIFNVEIAKIEIIIENRYFHIRRHILKNDTRQESIISKVTL